MSRSVSANPYSGARAAWAVLTWTLGVVPIVAGIFWPRSFNFPVYLSGLAQIETGFPAHIARAGTVMVVVVGAGVCGVGFLDRSAGRGGGTLWLGAMALAVGPLVASLFGTQPSFRLGYLAFPIVASAAYLLPPVRPDRFLMDVRRLCAVWIYGSLLAALVVPGLALERPYTQGLFPFPPLRLHGIAVHAGQLALVCLLYLALTPAARAGRRWRLIHLLDVVVVGGVLILTAYKSAWATALAIAVVHLASRYAKRWWRAAAAVGVLALGWAAASLGLFEAAAQAVAAQRERIVTLTGRTEIWRATLDVWRENPLFGYGPRLWDVDMSFRFLPTLGWAPAQAHNQVVQTLGEAGLIGLAGLAVYVVVLLRWGVRLRSRSNGSSLLLVMVLLFRSLADRWYSAGATDGNLFVHFVVFAALLLWVRSRAPLPTSLNRHPRGERRASRVPVGRT